DVLRPDRRLVIGEGYARRAIVDRRQHHLLGCEMRRVHLIGFRLRNVPILAKETAHIAAGGSHGEHKRVGEKMIERLLLDRINLKSCGPAITELQEAASFILANETEAGLAFAYVAVTLTKIAVQPAVGHRL